MVVIILIVIFLILDLKFSSSLHYKLNPEVEMMYKFNYGTGTTVYQGDNRFSLKNIQFFQNIMEIKEEDQFFVRAYRSQEDAGNSYDAVFTAIKLQEHNLVDNQDWYAAYMGNWNDNFSMEDLGWGNITFVPTSTFPIVEGYYTFNGEEINPYYWMDLTDSVLNANAEEIVKYSEALLNSSDTLSNQQKQYLFSAHILGLAVIGDPQVKSFWDKHVTQLFNNKPIPLWLSMLYTLGLNNIQ